jgi:hypothetical protein
MFRRLHRDEEGVALVTAMLVSMVVLSLGIVTIQLSVHNSDQSSFDRKRLQAVHAAEAGLDAYLAQLPRTAVASVQCTPAVATLPVDTGAQYQITATFYPTFPVVIGQEMACPLSDTNPPVGAVITSRGTAVAVGNARAVSRTMETEIKLNPILGGFGPAIFSHTALNLQNNLTVNGNGGNNGDIFTNGNFVCNNSSLDFGSINVQGSVTLGNSCTVIQDLRALGSINMSSSARVGHDATSSTGSITMANSSRIDNNARAASTCTGCTGRVGGTITTTSPSAPPPRIELPTVNYVASAWTAAGYTIQDFTNTNCGVTQTAVRNFVTALNGSTTKYVLRIVPSCAVSFDKLDIRMGADLAIVSNGAITTANRTEFLSATGAELQLYWIIPRSLFTPATPPDAPATNCSGQNIGISNQTIFTNVRTFFYTPCTANFDNNNNGLGGQIFGGTTNITNHFTLTYRPMLIPGAGSIVGFNTDIAYLRERTNA